MNLKAAVFGLIAATCLVISPEVHAECAPCSEGKVSLKISANSYSGDGNATLTVGLTIKKVMTSRFVDGVSDVEVTKTSLPGATYVDTKEDSPNYEGREVFIKKGDGPEPLFYEGTFKFKATNFRPGSFSGAHAPFELCPALEIRVKKEGEGFGSWTEMTSIPLISIQSIGLNTWEATIDFEIRIKRDDDDDNDDLPGGPGGGGPGGGGANGGFSMYRAELPGPAFKTPPAIPGGLPVLPEPGFVSKIDLGSGILALRASLAPSGAVAEKLTFAGYTANTIQFQAAALAPYGISFVLEGSGSTQFIRQVKTSRYLADIQKIPSGGFEIRVYLNNGVYTNPGAGGLFSPSGQPNGITRIVPIHPQGGVPGGIRVSETGSSGIETVRDFAASQTTSIETEGPRSIETTSLYVWDSDNQLWERTDSTVVKEDGIVVSHTEMKYLLRYVEGGTPLAITDTDAFLEYSKIYENTTGSHRWTEYSPDPDVFGRVKYEKSSDGSYRFNVYYTPSQSGVPAGMLGKLRQTFRSIAGSPSDPLLADESNSESTQYGVSSSTTTRPDLEGYPVVIRSDQETIGSAPVNLLTILGDSGVSANWIPMTSHISVSGSNSNGSSSTSLSYVTSLTYGIGEGLPPTRGVSWGGSSFGSLDGEGNGAITGYELGAFSTGVFAPGSPSSDEDPQARDVRVTTVKIMNGGLPVPAEQERTVTIRNSKGRTYAEYLYVGGATDAPATTTTYEYSNDYVDGSPRETTVRKDGRIVSIQRLVSDRVTESWDEQGIKTITTTDELGRTKTVTRKGHGNQPDMVTAYDYNGITSTVTATAGGQSRAETTVVDLVGRVVSQTDSSDATTRTLYKDHGRRVETVFLNDEENPIRITQSDIEGRTVSVTGPSVVGEYYQYETQGDGSLAITRRIGSLTSPRYKRTVADWLGRTVEVTTPSPTGTGEETEGFDYQGATRRLLWHERPGLDLMRFSVPTSGSSARLAGYDLDGSGELETPSEEDRITETRTSYELLEGFWWQVSTQKQYTSATTAVSTTSKTCLHGAPGGAAGKSITIDSSGLTTTTVTSIDRAAKKRTTTVSTNAATGTAVTVDVNGLTQSHKEQDADTAITWLYDAFGQPIKETSPRGAITQRRYYSDGKLHTVTDHANQPTTYTYYPATDPSYGQLATVTGPTGKTTTYTYTGTGQVQVVAGTATYRVEYGYDAYGIKNKMWTWKDFETAPNDKDLTEWVYQPGTGLLTQKKDAVGQGPTYTYHASGKLKTRLWQRGITTTYTYTDQGEPKSIAYSGETTPNVTFADFDRLGQPKKITQTGIGDEILSYSLTTGQLASRYYASGHTQLSGLGIRYTASDTAGRPSGFVETSDSGTTDIRTLSYGYYPGHGLLETVTDGTRSHTYAYHPNSSLIHTIRAREGSQDTFQETRAYDAQARLISIRSARIGSSSAQLTSDSYKYDALNRREKATQQDGSSWGYGYNDRSEVTSATRKSPSGQAIPELGATYAYDGIGNRKTSTSSILGDHTYVANSRNQYDTITTGETRTAIGRVPLVWSDIKINGTQAARSGELFHLPITLSPGQNSTQPVWKDIIVNSAIGGGNLPTKHFWYAKTPTVPAYDTDGNLTNDGRWTYLWDAENRLIQMETTPAATSADHPYTKVKAKYDVQGRRISRTVWQGGTAGNPTFKSNHRYLYDGWNVITEFSAPSETSTILTRQTTLTWGLDLSNTPQGAGGVGGLLSISSRITNNPITFNSFYPSYDGNGNIIAWSQKTSATSIARREYDAFGNTLVSEGNLPSSYGFSTKPQDVETGLYYYGYRYYDPVIGRWSSRDPIEEEGGINLYSFVGNEVVNLIDLLGHEVVCSISVEYTEKYPMKDLITSPGWSNIFPPKLDKTPPTPPSMTSGHIYAGYMTLYSSNKNKIWKGPVLGGGYKFHSSRAGGDTVLHDGNYKVATKRGSCPSRNGFLVSGTSPRFAICIHSGALSEGCIVSNFDFDGFASHMNETYDNGDEKINIRVKSSNAALMTVPTFPQ